MNHVSTTLILLALLACGGAQTTPEEALFESQAVLEADAAARAGELLAFATAEPHAPVAELALRMLSDVWSDLPTSEPYRKALDDLRTTSSNPHVREIARHLCRVAATDLGDDEAARARAADYHGLDRWAFVAPFGTSTNVGQFEAMFPPELDSDPSETHLSRGKLRRWQPVRVADDRYPGAEVPREGAGFAYARALVELDEPLDGFLAFDATLPCKVWIDGVLVHVADSYRGIVLTERAVGVKLSAGRHEVLLKVSTGEWLGVRFLDANEETVAVTLADPLDPELAIDGSAEVTERRLEQTALAHYRDRSEAGADDLYGALAYAFLLESFGDGDASLVLREEVVGEGAAPGALLQLGRGLRDTRMRPAAMAENRMKEILGTIGEMAPQSTLPSIALAQLELQRDRHLEALNLLEAALVRVPGNRAVRLELVDLFRTKGWVDEARRELEAMLVDSPEDVELLSLLREVEAERGNHQRAHELRDRLLELRPADEGLIGDLASAHLRAGRVDLAEELYLSWLTRAPEDASRLRGVRRFYLQSGQLERALEVLATEIELDDDDASLHAEKGGLLVRLGRRAEAVDAFREALGHEPSDQRLRDYIAFLTRTEDDAAAQHLTFLEDLESTPSAEDYPEAASVLVLDEGYVRYYEDGSYTADVYSCRKVLTREGIDRVATQGVNGELLVARTHTPDGRVLEPIRVQGNSFEMPGVDVGAIVELRSRYSVTGDDGKVRPYTWFFADSRFAEPFHLSRVVMVMPKDMPNVEITTRNFEGLHETTELPGDLVMHVWEVRESERRVPEFNMPPAEQVLPILHVETRGSWEDAFTAGRGFGIGGRPEVLVERRARELVDGIEDEEEQVRALYEFVNDHVEQDGREGPTVTLIGKQGNRRALFLSMARALDLDVRTVELGPDPLIEPDLDYSYGEDVFSPSDVTAVKVGEDYLWIDFGSRYLPFGTVRSGVGGKLVLLHGAEGAELSQLPEPELLLGQMVHDAELTVRKDGSILVRGTYRWNGITGAGLKTQLRTMDVGQHRLVAAQVLGQFYPGFNLTEFEFVALDEVSAPMQLAFAGTSSRMLVPEGDARRLVPGFAPLGLTRGLVRESEREMDYVSSAEVAISSRASVTLEEGVKLVDLPTPMNLVNPLGHLRLLHKRTGKRSFDIERNITLWPGRLRPDQYGEFVRFCKEADRSMRELPLVRVGE